MGVADCVLRIGAAVNMGECDMKRQIKSVAYAFGAWTAANIAVRIFAAGHHYWWIPVMVLAFMLYDEVE